MLRIEHLSKAYGEKKAVDDLNLHIAPGEIYGFIGHNGAGKTTTLKSVAGILQFDQGEIYVDGKSIRTQPLECKRTFAYIPDNPDLYDYMTGIKYLNFVADIFGVSAADRQDRIRQYAGLFELTEDLALTDDVAAKYHLKEGDTLTLHNAYDKDETHDFTVSGTYNSPGTMAIYLPIDDFREEFNQDAAYFNGYFSNEELTDLDEHMVASVITEDDLTKVSRQLENSMGNMMSLFIGFGVVMFLLLMYLLIKLIIEKNAQSISMVKVLGYSNGEVGRLYLVATTIVVLASLLLSLPLCDWCMRLIWNIYIAKEMSGWISYYVEPFMYVKMFLLGVAAYAVVAALQLLKIKRIPMTDALKNVE